MTQPSREEGVPDHIVEAQRALAAHNALDPEAKKEFAERAAAALAAAVEAGTLPDNIYRTDK